jgi:hypothetical protein
MFPKRNNKKERVAWKDFSDPNLHFSPEIEKAKITATAAPRVWTRS